MHTSAELMEAITGTAVDSPLCFTCGTKMRPAGSCYVCEGLREHQRLQLMMKRSSNVSADDDRDVLTSDMNVPHSVSRTFGDDR